MVLPVVRLNLLLLTPFIVFSISPDAIFQQQLTLIVAIPTVGVVGMLARKKSLVLFSYCGLLFLTIWAKVAGDIYSLSSPDSALLLGEFMITIFLMEAALAALKFDQAREPLGSKTDDLSFRAQTQLNDWIMTQIFNLGRLTLTSFVLALGLLLVGTVVSVSFNQLAFSGALVLGIVVVLMFLLTYRREPEARGRS